MIFLFIFGTYFGTGQIPTLGTGKATLNNKEQAPKEFWPTFYLDLPPFLDIEKFGKITISFSQLSLKAGDVLESKIKIIPDFTLFHGRHKRLRTNLLWVLAKKSFATAIFGKIC